MSDADIVAEINEAAYQKYLEQQGTSTAIDTSHEALDKAVCSAVQDSMLFSTELLSAVLRESLRERVGKPL